MAVLSACKLSHGGALYKFDSAESVQWLNVPAHRSKFLEHFGIETVIKDRSFNVLVENIPIAFSPENNAALAEVETKAGLKSKSIHRARYIKPMARRNPDQRTAHAIFTFGSKESTNQAIKFGLSVEGKKVYGRKLISEPTRCLKCHSFDGSHVAANCPQDNDSCGTCCGAHRTSTCSVTDQNQYCCKNCEEEGHAAWSRNCPTFTSKWENHKKRNEDAKYRFYLTEDPLTWETLTNQGLSNDREPEQLTRQQAAPQQHHPPPNAPTWEWRTVN
ncbi:uncharacterized protein F5147DRAFT_635631 [Suillus discolor]|uniref:CCHC-type domain-containing protein n=1 Tax=Suillus discolor TaxID=1912936 RepID=A0A9P7F6M9_9AGAM|nr:uncharacterized protein F5147DRAFT_635631 [Suillus discolor]KAG2108630.1 hypothetical protein F5147DRAFT_635631 [Suillus discolor]